MGEVIKFSDLITFSAGTNLTRLSGEIPDACIYNLEDFDRDLGSLTEVCKESNMSTIKGKRVTVNAGDAVISMTRNQAVIVSGESIGKYLNSNFVKCEFDREILYPWYFCYLLNESVTISQQIRKIQQGTLGCINRLTIGTLGSLEFKLGDLSQQQKIGNLYRNLLVREHLVQKQLESVKKCTLELIRKVDGN